MSSTEAGPSKLLFNSLNGWSRPLILYLLNLACKEIKAVLNDCCFVSSAELKISLSSFIELETTLDYDREAELALHRLTTGDVDVNQLTNAWTRSYVEVRTHLHTNIRVLTSATSIKLEHHVTCKPNKMWLLVEISFRVITKRDFFHERGWNK